MTEFEQIKQLAEDGDAEAECLPGHLYHDGDVVKKNDQSAVIWWAKMQEKANELYALGDKIRRKSYDKTVVRRPTKIFMEGK